MAKSSASVKRRRDALRAMGMRPIQIWVPDTRAPGFAEEYQRQMRNIIEAETDESRAEDEAWFALSVEGLDESP
ncbi:MAG: antitoxin MazE family protein [Rhodopila sp.]